VGVSDGISIAGGSGTHEAGMFTCASEIARLGLLYLNKGKWNGEQLLSEDWVAQATSPQVPNTLAPFKDTSWYAILPGSYGFGFWVNGTTPGNQPFLKNAPPHTAIMQGFMNNNCFIIPEWEMVVVRFGTDKEVIPTKFEEFFSLMDQAVVERTGVVSCGGY
jgi:CubicO group peptidase (beta-lactamase class C family)